MLTKYIWYIVLTAQEYTIVSLDFKIFDMCHIT